MLSRMNAAVFGNLTITHKKPGIKKDLLRHEPGEARGKDSVFILNECQSSGTSLAFSSATMISGISTSWMMMPGSAVTKEPVIHAFMP